MGASPNESSSEPSAAGRAPRKGFTPPKGRPTRSQHGGVRRRRLFGPIAQWTAVVLAVLLVLVALIWITDGGDFNPFDGGAAPVAPVTEVAAAADPV